MTSETTAAARYRSCSELAREYGLTVPRLKKYMRDSGWLNGHSLTARALSEGLAVVEQVGGRVSGARAIKKFKPAAVESMLATYGVDNRGGRAHLFFIGNRHEAAERITDSVVAICACFDITEDHEYLPDGEPSAVVGLLYPGDRSAALRATLSMDWERLEATFEPYVLWEVLETSRGLRGRLAGKHFPATYENARLALASGATAEGVTGSIRLHLEVIENAARWVDEYSLKG